MAELPPPELYFDQGCPDCGGRRIDPPVPPPPVPDDFDWLTRDFAGFRAAMITDLSARFPDRRQWNPADLEVALVETLAAMLDWLSDMNDRVAAEATLETARRPRSVDVLLRMIGFDAAEFRGLERDALYRLWRERPETLAEDRAEGPRRVRRQERMVTLDDYMTRLAGHPLIERAFAWEEWGGSWYVIRVAAITWDGFELDEPIPHEPPELLRRDLARFRDSWGPEIAALPWGSGRSTRSVVRAFLDAQRLAGQEVILEDALAVGIALSLVVTVRDTYFRSEVERAVRQALGTGAAGFFRPGRLGFGEDLYVSDIYQQLMALEGVQNVCIRRFKRVGRRFPDESLSGRIRLDGLEFPVCDLEGTDVGRGFLRLELHGGLLG